MKKLILTFLVILIFSELSSAQWTDTGVPLQGLATKGTTFYGGTNTGPKISTDGGQTWTATGTAGLVGTGTQIRGLGATANYIFAASPLLAGNGGIYRSVDGDNWEKTTESLSSITKVADKFYEQDGRLFVTLTAGAPGVSKDEGATWSLLFPDARNGFSVTRLFPIDGTLYAATNSIKYDGTNASAILKSTDNGDTWTEVNSGILGAAGVFVTSTGRIIVCENVASKRLNYSDDGVNWTTSASSIAFGIATDFFEFEGVIYMASGLGGAGVFQSTDDGATWTAINSGLSTLTKSNASIFAYNGTNLLVGINAVQSNVAYLVPGATAAPEITVSISGSNVETGGSFDFGDVEESTEGAPIEFTIENEGDADLIVGDIVLSGEDASNYVLTESTSNTTIAPNGSNVFTIAFSPLAGNLGQLDAVLTINSDDSDEASFTVDLTGNSTEPPLFPDIEIEVDGTVLSNPGSVAFGLVNISENVSMTVTIRNTGENTLEINGTPVLELTGADVADFTLDDTSLSTMLDPGATTNFTINFQPEVTGSKSAQLSIASNVTDSSPFILNLLGDAIESTVTALAPHESLSINIYPNPFSGQLSLDLPNTEYTDWTISISDLSGRTVYFRHLNTSSSLRFDLSNIKQGHYALMLRNLTSKETVRRSIFKIE